jgi:SAM-dependent methyltransferase
MDIKYFHQIDRSYSKVSEEYTGEMFNELDHKPLDREILRDFSGKTNGKGLVLDLGCGPGQIGGYLQAHGVYAAGIDLAYGMVRKGLRLNPEMSFIQANMLSLPFATNSLAGIAAFYSVIHIPHHIQPALYAEFLRALRPGGYLLISFHIGSEIVHLDDWWEKPVQLDFIFFEVEMVENWVRSSGFTDLKVTVREPYPNVEYPSQRCYILAQKPLEG